jgi:hypothetical protein
MSIGWTLWLAVGTVTCSSRGGKTNQGKFYTQFDHIALLLTVPSATACPAAPGCAEPWSGAGPSKSCGH